MMKEIKQVEKKRGGEQNVIPLKRGSLKKQTDIRAASYSRKESVNTLIKKHRAAERSGKS